MRLLPVEQMSIWVGPDGTVAVGAHEHNGAVWWTKLPDPLDDPAVQELKGVLVNDISSRPHKG